VPSTERLAESSLNLKALVRLEAAGPEPQRCLFPGKKQNGNLPEEIVNYTSGTNRLSDIRGALAAGAPIGVDISRLSKAAIKELLASSAPVFLDSGAFGEVAMRYGRAAIVHPISDDQWNRRLDNYLRITRQIGRKRRQLLACRRVTVVAPDCVGNQELTLQRLARFRDRVRQIHAAGADVVVPMQMGRLNVLEFFKHAHCILGFEIVAGMPMNKAATTANAIQELLRDIKPERIHLLGMGTRNRKAGPIISLIRRLAPTTLISMDANCIRAAVGKNRPITRAEKQYSDDLIPSWTAEVDLREWGRDVHDFTELIFQPSYWLTGAKLNKFAESLTWLTRHQTRDFLRSPDQFVNSDEHSNDWLHERLTQAYFEYVSAETRRAARTRAVFETLREHTIPAYS
jgi:hypothetical protein